MIKITEEGVSLDLIMDKQGEETFCRIRNMTSKEQAIANGVVVEYPFVAEIAEPIRGNGIRISIWTNVNGQEAATEQTFMDGEYSIHLEDARKMFMNLVHQLLMS